MSKFKIVATLAVLAALTFAAGCGGVKPGAPLRPGDTTPGASPVAPPSLACLKVSQAFLDVLRVPPPAAAVKVAVDPKAGGVGRNSHVAWFVSTPGGATWLTSADPTSADPGGLIVPLNDKARAASEVGIDVKPGAPVYGEFTDASPEAVASRTCAARAT
jgi:hypothetical protein